MRTALYFASTKMGGRTAWLALALLALCVEPVASRVVVLTDENFDEYTASATDLWMIEFYAVRSQLLSRFPGHMTDFVLLGSSAMVWALQEARACLRGGCSTTRRKGAANG